MTVEPETRLIGVMDGRFIPKSGKHTEGLSQFYHGVRGKAEKGLEISTLAVVKVTANTADNLSTRPTPATMKSEESRIDFSLEHLKPDRESLPTPILDLITDGYDANKKYLDGVAQLD